ncbi:MAG: LCP family protein [Actinomycetota bacterium]
MGPRRSALSRRRRTFRKRSLAGGSVALLAGALILLVVGIVAGTNAVVNRGNDGDSEPSRAAAGSLGDLTTYLILGTDSTDGAPQARWMTLIGLDDNGKASIAYLPAHTAYEVPGLGLQGIGEALGAGGVSLVSLSIENMLGVPVDHFIELPSGDADALFRQTGDLTVNVPQEVRVSAGADAAQVLFDAGEQTLPPRFQVDLLYEIGLESDETELGARHLVFWQAFLETHSADPDALGAALEGAAGALDSSDSPSADQVSFFTELVSLPMEDVSIASLPVEEEVVGETELYSIDDAEIHSFVEDTFGSSSRGDQVRVQILNGNADPSAAQEVAEKLVGRGFKVVLSGNADRLDYGDTRLLVYDSTPEAQVAGERARELLGVGDIQVSVQQQGIVDLTIVVGKDFIDATEADSD